MRRKDRQMFGLLLLLVAASIGMVYWISTASSSVTLTVDSVDGEVSFESATRPDVDASVGLSLRPDERITTGKGGHVVLSVGEETKIRLGAESSVKVQSVRDNEVQLELENGALHAVLYSDSGPALRVTNEGRSVLATSGQLDVGVGEQGLMVVEPIGADAILSGTDKTRVPRGTRATISGSKVTLGPIPQSLLLSVDWPEPNRTRNTHSMLRGKTQPGTEISIEGGFGTLEVTADLEGSFSGEVPLIEGENDIFVRASGVLGDRKMLEGSLETRDTQGPTFQGGVKYDK